MTDTPNELDEILEQLTFDVVSNDVGASSAECAGYRYKAKAKLQALIDQELREARIDELEKYYVEISDLTHEGTAGVDDLVERGYLENYYEDRLAQLKGVKKDN